MAHRGPLREIFGIICISGLFAKVQKVIPKGSTGLIIDHNDSDDLYKYTAPPIITPPTTTGFAPFLLSLLLDAISLLGQEFLLFAAFWTLNNGLLPSLRVVKNGLSPSLTVIKRLTLRFGTSAYRRLWPSRTNKRVIDGEEAQKPGVTDGEEARKTSVTDGDEAQEMMSPEAIAPMEEDDDGFFDAVESQQSQEGAPNDTSVSPANDRELTELREESARKDEQIAELTSDRERVSNENTRLNDRVTGLEQAQQSSAQAVARSEASARAREETLTDRALFAEHRASAAEDRVRNVVTEKQHKAVTDQLRNVMRDRQQMIHDRHEAVDAQGRLTTELESERARIEALQASADNQAAARQHTESLLITATENLQQANTRITNLETEAHTRNDQVQEAEKKAQATENQTTERATSVNELRQSLQNAQAQAIELRESNERLTENLGKAEEALKNKSRDVQPEVTPGDDSTESTTEMDSLRQQLSEAKDEAVASFQNGYLQALSENPPSGESEETDKAKDPQDAPTQAADPQTQPLYHQGYNAAVEACKVEAMTAIENAVRQEATEAAERLTAAVTQAEQAAQTLIQDRWNAREAEFTNRENTLRAQLNSELQGAIQRAMTAESRIKYLDNELSKAQIEINGWEETAVSAYSDAGETKRADEAEEKVALESSRANKAEAEIKKYQKGKADQDQRIKKLHEEISALKRLSAQQPTAAELQALENDRTRVVALCDESIERQYDDIARRAVSELLFANNAIDDLRVALKKASTKPDRTHFLTILKNAEVDSQLYQSFDPETRNVLLRQCRAVNARLMALRQLINSSDKPDKGKLLNEIYLPRGDEEVRWAIEDGTREVESYSKDHFDDFPSPADRPRALPVSRRNRPAQQAAVQVTPLPSDPNANKPLKRKGSVDDEDGPSGESKRQPDSVMGMRPIAGPSSQPPQQGSSFPAADDDVMETKTESQDEFPSSDRIGEGSAPRQQSNDQTDSSLQLPGSLSFPNQHTAPTNPSISFGISWKTNPSLPPKPTKIPIPTTAAGPSTFTFSPPKDVASVVNTDPAPAQPNHEPIFKGLSLLGAAMAAKDAALPGLPPKEEDEVIEFESSGASKDEDAEDELDDGFLAHIASNDEEDEDGIAWEDVAYPKDFDDWLERHPHTKEYDDYLEHHTHTSMDDGDGEGDGEGGGDDTAQSPIHNIDMTDQNYEEQAAEAAAAAAKQGVQQNPPKKKKEDKPENGEEEEDPFRINLDRD